MDYRRDIDGLRAIAVLSVMLFHAKVPGFAGGFVGVDVFFVISGFLITNIIFGELEREEFSIIRFYERRVRRIIPALFFMIAASIALFFPFMLPDDLENFGQSIVATTAFANNVLLWVTSGYFEPSVDLKPLAHTWSLGVEEQYYLVMPLIMIAAYRIGGRRAVMTAIATISVGSFAFALRESRIDQNFNFYIITSRFWELGVGSIAAFNRNRWLGVKQEAANLASLVGIVAILASIMVLEGHRSNPDEITLFPVLGTALVILFAREGVLILPVLTNRVAVGIGLISYSLYLWHQPLYVLLRLTSLEEPRPLQYLPSAALTFLVGYISWRFVEGPFRARGRVSRGWVFATAGVASFGAVAIGLAFHLTSGFYDRWPELASNDREFTANRNSSFNLEAKRFTDRVLPPESFDRNVLVVGDSFARDVINVFRQDPLLATLEYSYSEVAECDEAAQRVKTIPLADNARFVVLGWGVDGETAACQKTLSDIIEASGRREVIVFGDKNFGWNNNGVMLIPETTRYAFRAKVREEALVANEVGRATFPDGNYVDLLSSLGLDREGRVPVFTPDRKFISQDRQHLMPAGARYLAVLLRDHPALSAMRRAASATGHVSEGG